MKHVVRVSDGLGNQMFQYAFAYALAKKTGAEVLLDPLFWGTSLRKYQLEEFNIKISEKLINDFVDYVLGFGPRNGRKFKDLIRQKIASKYYRYIQEDKIMHFDERVWKQNENSFFVGFWQTPQYFDEYYLELKEQFTLKRQLSDKAKKYLRHIKEKNSVSLHVRRTDYVREKDSAALQLDFYDQALKKIKNKIGDYNLFVFSDDKDFIRSHFSFCHYKLVDGVDDLEEFELMRQCNHHIVANSTFSWWAAYLGENKGGIVYAPCTGIWSKEFYPKEWNLIYTDTVR